MAIKNNTNAREARVKEIMAKARQVTAEDAKELMDLFRAEEEDKAILKRVNNIAQKALNR